MSNMSGLGYCGAGSLQVNGNGWIDKRCIQERVSLISNSFQRPVIPLKFRIFNNAKWRIATF